MICTITLNPSIDISYQLPQFERNAVNRCSTYLKSAGGKGINVSRVLKQLDAEVVATGFLGGQTGRFIEQELKGLDIYPEFVTIGEETRNCIAILSAGEQTEILEAGPTVTEAEGDVFIERLRVLLQRQQIRVLCASGSLPRGLPQDFYARLINLAKQYEVKFLLDTSGPALSASIKAAPYLIKPNLEELEALAGEKIHSERELIAILHRLSSYPVDMIVVSLGAEGCMALCGGRLYRVRIPQVDVINPVGSGDAFVAGMSHELARQSSFEEVLRVGVTCGTLNAMHEKTGCIEMEQFAQIYEKVEVHMLD